MKKTICVLIVCFIYCIIFLVVPCVEVQSEGKNERILTLAEFMVSVARNDTEFEEILIDELSLRYEKDLILPARDLVFDIKTEYDFMLDHEREEPRASVGLSKLFPFTGTALNAEYATTPSYTSGNSSTEMTYELTQPIARNAFGHATRLKDKIIGLEIDVAKHQIVEAYEDYLATLIVAYYDWYEAYENVLISKSSYVENVKLLDNIKDRQKSKIAVSVDVNKTELQVLAKKEKLISLQETYSRALNIIQTALRHENQETLIPQKPLLYTDIDIVFDRDFDSFNNAGRTFQVLHLLEAKSELDVDENADDLLPSIDLLFGYNVKGTDRNFDDSNNMMYAGVSLQYPFPSQVERAEYAVAKIARDKTAISNKNVYYQLWRDCKNVWIAIKREKELIAIADEKIKLGQSVLDDESENYTYGKVTLNDYIQAVNALDTNRFNKVAREVEVRRLIVEWLRLTDQLISRKEIEEQQK
ncbi:TolC family protein [Candidatus Omnitrophota bacterium]